MPKVSDGLWARGRVAYPPGEQCRTRWSPGSRRKTLTTRGDTSQLRAFVTIPARCWSRWEHRLEQQRHSRNTGITDVLGVRRTLSQQCSGVACGPRRAMAGHARGPLAAHFPRVASHRVVALRLLGHKVSTGPPRSRAGSGRTERNAQQLCLDPLAAGRGGAGRTGT